MKKIAFVPLVLVVAMTGACTRSTDAAVGSAGSPASGQSVQLISDGLTTGSVGLHHANIIAFGATRAQVLAQLKPALGAPSALGRNEECPTGPVDFVSYGPLDLHFEDGGFAGWVIDEAGEPEFESYLGLSHGDLRSELDGDAEIEVAEDSSLGTELSFNGIGVLMSGPRQTDRVTALFSGKTCFAR